MTSERNSCLHFLDYISRFLKLQLWSMFCNGPLSLNKVRFFLFPLACELGKLYDRLSVSTVESSLLFIKLFLSGSFMF